jgi:hypothetical protein
MPAIVRNVVVIAVCAGALACAGPHAEIVDLFASMTAALADDNVPGFMNGFDRNMEQYDTLRASIDALVAEAEVTSAIESVKDAGDEEKRSVDLDWTLQIRSRQAAGPLVQRQQIVHAELVKQKKHWRIVSIRPLDFFAPAKFSESK